MGEISEFLDAVNTMADKGMDITLSDEEIKPIYLRGKTCKIHISGNVRITEEDCPGITVYASTEEVIIDGDGTLTIESGFRQPCIGARTRTGMSYGRWSVDVSNTFKKLTIDGVTVICENSMENFAIGTYNCEDVPEINVINGGRLEAPEATGKRVLATKAFAPQGSTKISADPKYIIMKDGDSPDDYLSDDIKEEIKNWPEDLKSEVSVYTLDKAVRLVSGLIKNKIPSYITTDKLKYMLSENSSSGVDYMYTGIVTGCSTGKGYFMDEMHLEVKKAEYMYTFLNKNLSDDDGFDCIPNIMNYINVNMENSFFKEHLLYEMIPAYDHAWMHTGNKYDDINGYINERYNKNRDKYLNTSLIEDRFMKLYDYSEIREMSNV